MQSKLFLLVLICVGWCWAKPMESLDNYLVILEHGINPNYHDNPADKGDTNLAYPEDKRASSIF